MSDYSQGPGWWQASDGKWYPPQQASAAPAAGPWGAAPQPGMPYAIPAYQIRSTNGLAIAALVCGVAGFVTCITAIPAVIMGHIARKQIRESNGTQQGDGMALAGIITGYAVLGLLVAYVIFVVVVANTTNDLNDTNNFGLVSGLLARLR